MTANKHFKHLVRERMEKTGERYAAARRQLLGQHTEARQSHPYLSGLVPLVTAFRILLTHRGVVHASGKPISEALTLGLCGGIGVGVCAFHYDSFSSFYVAGRHLWYQDQACLTSACERLGLVPAIKEFGSARSAEKGLATQVQDGPVIAWIDMGSLPHRGLPAYWSGGGYHLVTVYDSVPGGNTTLGDLAEKPISVPTDVITQARGRIKKDRYRLLSLPPMYKQPDLKSALSAGLAACADGLMKGRIKNFTVQSLHAWGDQLAGTSKKDSWEKVFPPGHRLWRGLTSLYEFVELFGTGGGLMRPLFAETLREAATLLRKPAYAKLAREYASLGERWSSLAASALPTEVESFAEAHRLLDAKKECLLSSASETDARQVCDALETLGQERSKTFPLSDQQAEQLRLKLQQQVRVIAHEEARLAEELAAVQQ